MHLLIDSVKYQKENGFVSNRHPLAKIKSDSAALKEAAEMIRGILSECIDRKLPIDDAFAALHVATVKNKPLTEDDYKKMLEKSKDERTSQIKQNRSTVSLLKKIAEEHKKHG